MDNTQLDTPAGTSTAPAATPDEPATDPAADSQADARPELSIRLAAPQEAALIVAVEAAIGRCMADHGFEYHHLDTATFTQGIRYRNEVIEAQGFPLGDPSHASSGLVEPDAADPNANYVASLDDSARAAFNDALSGSERADVTLDGFGFSVATNGCRAQGSELVYGGDAVAVQTGSMLVGNLSSTAHAITSADDRVRTSQAEWSRCMSERGFSYDDFAAAAEDRAGRDPVEASEIEAADLACSVSSGLAATYRAVFNETYLDAYERYREPIDQYRALQTQAARSQ